MDDPTPAGTGDVSIGDVLEAMAAYHHLDDPGAPIFTLGVALSAQLDGDPVWGMLVGASSGGKTEAIRLLDDRAEPLDELTTAGLLTWIPAKGGRGHEAGALRRIGARGLVTVSDFSTVLATSDRGGRDQLFASLRKVYDGAFTRNIGTAPHPLRWEGRATFVAGCTPAIDNYAAHADQLGPRWLYYRLREQDTETSRLRARRAQRAASDIDPRRKKARRLAGGLLHAAARRLPAVQVDEAALERLVDLAIVVCLGRAAVKRHGYGRREIDGLPTVESSPRVTLQLTALLRCLLALGLDEAPALRLCERAGLSSMPDIRRRVLAELAHGEELSVSDLARRCRAHRHPVRFALEELQTVDLVDCEDHQDGEDPGRFPASRPWWLAGDDAQLVAETVGAHAWDRPWTLAEAGS